MVGSHAFRWGNKGQIITSRGRGITTASPGRASLDLKSVARFYFHNFPASRACRHPSRVLVPLWRGQPRALTSVRYTKDLLKRRLWPAPPPSRPRGFRLGGAQRMYVRCNWGRTVLHKHAIRGCCWGEAQRLVHSGRMADLIFSNKHLSSLSSYIYVIYTCWCSDIWRKCAYERRNSVSHWEFREPFRHSFTLQT